MIEEIRWNVKDRYGNEVYLSEEYLFRTITLSRHIRKRQGFNMEHATFNYDETSDTLYISFSPGESATGIELSDHILLRLNKRERRAVGLTLFEYSLLAQRTELGPRSFPLTGLAGLSSELRELVLELLRQPPLSDILTLTAYTPSLAETIPTASLQPMSIAAT